MPYSEGDAVKGLATPEVYRIEGGLRRWIPDPETLMSLGYTWDVVRVLPQAEVDAIPLGQPVPSVKTAPTGNRLSAGEALDPDERLASPNGRFSLRMQTDGNLVLYETVDVSQPDLDLGPDDDPRLPNFGGRRPIIVPPGTTSRPYWATDTWHLPADQRPTQAHMQTDGHLVLYDAAGRARWGSGTWGTAFQNPYLALGDDGNLVIYANGSQPVWASGNPSGVGRIAPRGQVDQTPNLNLAVDQCGRLPAVISGSTSLGTPTETTIDASGVAYRVTEQRRRFVNDVVEQAYLQDLAAMGVWPGQVVQGRPLLNGDVAAIGPFTRAPGTVSVTTRLIYDRATGDLTATGPPSQSAQVAAPDSASVNQTLNQIAYQVNPVDSTGILKASFERASTFREVGAKLGVHVKGSAFEVDANASLNTTYKQSTAVAVIRQVYYSATFTPSGAGAQGFWPASIDWDDLKPYASPGNPPLYIDSVQYGRFICVTAQGSYSSTDLTAALKASYESGITGSGSFDMHFKEILENSQIRLYTIGVPGRTGFQTVADPLSELPAVFQSGLAYNANTNPGAPISFICRHIADNSVARVAVAAEYVQPLSALGIDVNDALFFLHDGPGGGLVDTGINANPGDHVIVSSGGLIDSGVVASAPHGPDGWLGHTPNSGAPMPAASSAYGLIIRFGRGSWIAVGRFWEADVSAQERGRLQLNINDDNPYNGDPRYKWSSKVDVRRANAAAAGIFV